MSDSTEKAAEALKGLLGSEDEDIKLKAAQTLLAYSGTINNDSKEN